MIWPFSSTDASKGDNKDPGAAERRRPSPRAIVAWLAAAAGLAYAARLHWFFLADPGPVGFDDGYTLALGERLIDGQWLPYVDGASHRGPLLYVAAAIAQLATGRFGWLGGRLLSAVTMMATVGEIFAIGVVARMPLAGAVALLFQVWALFGIYPFGGSFSVTGEGVAAPLAVAALLCTTVALVRPVSKKSQLTWLFVGGVSAALAALAKQTLIFAVVPLALWTLAKMGSRESASRRDWLRPVAALSLGFAAVFVLTVLRYALAGELGTFWYWYYTYNAEIYMAPYDASSVLPAINSFMKDHPWALGALAFVLAPSLARPFMDMGAGWRGIARGYASHGLETTAALLVVVTFVPAVAPLRFWPHYFQCVFPFIGIVLGMRAESLLRGHGRPLFRTIGVLVTCAMLVGLVGQVLTVRLHSLEKERRKGGWQTPVPEPLCQLIDDNSQPEDTIFVWGFGGDIYLTCRRHPASRFTYLTLVAGMVPPRWGETHKKWVARGAREDLLADLDAERPSVIIDMPGMMGNVYMSRIPQLRKYLERKYCKLLSTTSKNNRKADVWLRKDRPACAGKG